MNPQYAIRNTQHATRALCVLLLLLPLLAPGTAPSTGPHLTIAVTNLPDATAQPLSGRWNPLTGQIQIPAEASTGQLRVYCGPTIAVSWLTQTGLLYECQASADLKTWYGSNLRIIGTGQPVTLYDLPNTNRAYRVLATPDP